MIRLDLIKQAVASAPGTGDISLGSGQTGFIGIQDHPDTTDGMTVEYIAIDGNNKEFGIGTYSATGDVLTRTWIQGKIESGVYSKNPGTGVNLTANAVIQCGPVATNMNFRGCLITKSSPQSITNITQTAASYDTEIFDTNAFHDSAVNASRITIPAGVSVVRLSGCVRFAANSTGHRYAFFVKNGNQANLETTSIVRLLPVSTFEPNYPLSPIVDYCTPGDYYEIVVYQDSGAPLNIASSKNGHYFLCEVIQ